MLTWGHVCLPLLRLVAFAGLPGTELAEKRRHPHAFSDETGSRALHGCEKIASTAVDPGQLSQIHFDLPVGAK
jgi:hypothetical protein